MTDGKLAYGHNCFETDRFFVRAPSALPSGTVNVQYQFDNEGGQPGAGGDGTLLVNGAVVAEGRIDKTVPFIFSADETMDIGQDTASPVSDDYPSGPASAFAGTINWVQVDLVGEELAHTEDPEQTYHRILARQ